MSQLAITTPLSASAPKPTLPGNDEERIAKIIRYILMQEQNLSGVLSKPLVEHVLYQPKEPFFKQFADSLQEALDLIDLTSIDEKKELFITNIMTSIPYTYPKVGDTFKFLVKNQDGHYERKLFTCDTILPTSVSTSLTPLNAYGFKSDNGENILLFTGTTLPAAGGFLNSLLADFTPFTSVGKVLFKRGFDRLKDYFKTHSDVRLFGKSLGGALCLHTLCHFEASIKDVYAVVPPGLHMWDGYNKGSDKQVTIVTQAGDIVSQLGYFPEHANVKVFHLKAKGNATKGLYAHARIFAGSPDTEISQLEPKQVNRCFTRRVITVMHIAFSWLIFIGLILVLVCYKCKQLGGARVDKHPQPFTQVKEPIYSSV